METQIENIKYFEAIPKPIYKKIIPLKSGNRIHFVKLKDIKYIVASRYYAEVNTIDKTYVVRESLSRIILPIKKRCFVRIHRSTIINKDFVKDLLNSNHGEIDVIMIDNSSFRVGRSYKDQFLQNIGFS